MKTNEKSFLIRYGTAVLLAMAGLLLRSLLTPLLGIHVPFSTFYPAIVASALFGGLRAGLLTTLISGLAANSFFIPALGGSSLSLNDTIQLILFFSMGALISWIVKERELIQTRLRQVETESEKQARIKEKALRESERRSQMTQKFAGVGIWEWNIETGEVEWSEGIYKLLGLKTRDLNPSFELWNDCMHPDDREASMAKMQKLIADGHNEFSNEFRIVRADDGAVRWIASQGQIFRDEARKTVRLSGVNYDITPRKEAELKIKNLNLELNRRVKELQTIFDIAPVGIAVAQDANCNVISANPALAEILGVDPGENISVNPNNARQISYKHFKDGREIGGRELPMQRAVAEKRTIFGDEMDILRADGKTVTIYCYAAPVFDEDGNVISCIAAHIDITERKNADRERQRRLDAEHSLRMQAEEANRLKDEFLATISHELRTPLNSIIGWVTMLRDDRLPDSTKRKAVEAIERGAKSQSQLIEDLLDVSRIISGKLRLKTQPLEPKHVINTAIETLRPAAEAKNIKIETEFKTPVGLVAGDYDRLQQIVWNLLSNAIKFTPQNGEVKVVLQSDDSRAEIIVTDNGKGIDPEFLPFVFDRFRQADGSITRNFTGLGLGLAIVRHLVELHGGTVSVESEGDNKGATFRVKLPLASDLDLNNKQSERPSENPNIESERFANDYPLLKDIRILVVDDERDTREILKMAFENCQATVETAASAFEALQMVKTVLPQIIVSDIGMPGEDGYSFMRKVRIRESENKKNQTPILAVALTAYARAEDRKKSLDSGFEQHISKPVEPLELTKIVAKLFNARESRF